MKWLLIWLTANRVKTLSEKPNKLHTHAELSSSTDLNSDSMVRLDDNGMEENGIVNRNPNWGDDKSELVAAWRN